MSDPQHEATRRRILAFLIACSLSIAFVTWGIISLIEMIRQ